MIFFLLYSLVIVTVARGMLVETLLAKSLVVFAQGTRTYSAFYSLFGYGSVIWWLSTWVGTERLLDYIFAVWFLFRLCLPWWDTYRCKQYALLSWSRSFPLLTSLPATVASALRPIDDLRLLEFNLTLHLQLFLAARVVRQLAIRLRGHIAVKVAEDLHIW